MTQADTSFSSKLLNRLEACRTLRKDDPFANPVLLLSRDIAEDLYRGDASLEDISQEIQRLSVQSFNDRSTRLRDYSAVEDAALDAALDSLFHDDEGHLLTLEACQKRLAREDFGIVLTAHPTFGIDEKLMQEMAECASSESQTCNALVTSMPHLPGSAPTLADEHAQSITTLHAINDALLRLYERILEKAVVHFPDDWHSLQPRLITAASWVGYDLDGRSDIPWHSTLGKAFRVSALQLKRLRELLVEEFDDHKVDQDTARSSELLITRLQIAERDARDAADHLDQPALDLEDIAKLSRDLQDRGEPVLNSARKLLPLMDELIVATTTQQRKLRLVSLRSLMANTGLQLAHIHTRINARQIHNAIRAELGLKGSSEDPGRRLSFIHAVTEALETVEPVQCHFGTIDAEPATARQTCMVIAEILHLIDADQPVRFLIAETESIFTLLSALYFCRRFGIVDKTDISPLFETRRALEHGHEIIEAALIHPAYRRYLEKRGRLCVQTGYSDAGRYLGQTAAAYAIERLRIKIIDLLEKHDLTHIELVMFDTHGESMGRGGHPASLADRFAYFDTDYSRAQMKHVGLRHKQETSFQGGDGYVHYRTPQLADQVIGSIMTHVTRTIPDEALEDPLYADTIFSEEFFGIVTAFNDQVMNDPEFACLLGTFGANFLYPSGSRALKRQHEDRQRAIILEHASQLRAIPQNATVQQLGFLANVLGGLGRAVARDPGRFQEMYHSSDRFRRLMTMVEHAFKYSDLTVLKAYLNLYDPGLWHLRAYSRDESDHFEILLRIADMMQGNDLFGRLTSVYYRFQRDHIFLSQALREHRHQARERDEKPIVVSGGNRDAMHLLHSMRLALIQYIFMMSARIPQFSQRHDINRAELLELILHLDLDRAKTNIDMIFPRIEERDDQYDFGIDATYDVDRGGSYERDHDELYKPMMTAFELIKRISAGVSHHIGAFG